MKKKLEIALEALSRIASGKGICVSYEYDPAPTEREIAQRALEKISDIDVTEVENARPLMGDESAHSEPDFL